jgi:hypothetical protein
MTVVAGVALAISIVNRPTIYTFKRKTFIGIIGPLQAGEDIGPSDGLLDPEMQEGVEKLLMWVGTTEIRERHTDDTPTWPSAHTPLLLCIPQSGNSLDGEIPVVTVETCMQRQCFTAHAPPSYRSDRLGRRKDRPSRRDKLSSC